MDELKTDLRGARIAVVADPKRYGMAFRELAALGAEATAVRDGDPFRRECDILLLYRSARTFHRYEKILGKSNGSRPLTILWQHEPLLPVEMPEEFEQKALQAARIARSRLWHQPIYKLLHRNLYRSIADTGLGLYSAHALDGVDYWKVRSMAESYSFIRNGFDEGWLDRIFVSTVQKQRFLASRGIPSGFAPIGRTDELGENRSQVRDIDILFVGNAAKAVNRRRKLAILAQRFRKAGRRFEIVERGVYGEERTRLLNRTKLVLHLHNIPWDTPWVRWNIVSANGALVVSEPLSVPEPFVPGTHYVEAPFDDLPETIEKLLNDPQTIRQIAQRCDIFIRQNMSTGQSLRTVICGDYDRTTSGSMPRITAAGTGR